MAGIYLHIPFCKSFCSYCDFYSVTDTENTGRFVDAIIAEAAMRSGYLGGETVETVYFGGGTPSLLAASDIKKILSAISERHNLSGDPEITLEANPDDINDRYLGELAAAGINRLSFGIQSWNDARLKYLGRRHTAAESARALDGAFRAGFKNVSADLIYGVPGMTTA